MSTPSRTTHWLPSSSSMDDDDFRVDSLCFGTGRFLRAVLVPSLIKAGLRPALIQPRGRTFLEYMAATDRNSSQNTSKATTASSGPSFYPVDTVEVDGSVTTEHVPCWGAFSMGSLADKEALMDWLPSLKKCISVFGVGVTEAGLASVDTQAMKDVYKLLQLFQVLLQQGTWMRTKRKICVICTDNIPSNGDVLRGYMIQISQRRKDVTMESFLEQNVVFLNSMVDRITSEREHSNGMVPRCEPVPKKSLVLLDPDSNLPPTLSQQPGVVIRSRQSQLETDVALKLLIANGTHTAIAHSLALLGHPETTILSTKDPGNLFMNYLESLVNNQIVPAATASVTTNDEALEVWSDWKARLKHPTFGLSTFFITQNGAVKGGIRWGDTIRELLKYDPGGSDSKVSVSFAFAYAALLRWLTPSEMSGEHTHDYIFKGWLDQNSVSAARHEGNKEHDQTMYADGLSYNIVQGWYEFKCDLLVRTKQGKDMILPHVLRQCHGKQPSGCVDAVWAYLIADKGGGLGYVESTPGFNTLVCAVATLYARLLSGDGIYAILQELSKIGYDSSCHFLMDGESAVSVSLVSGFKAGVPLRYHPSPVPDDSRLMHLPVDIESATATTLAEVAAAEVIDLHTHLLPPSHGALCLWGIDEILTYHYLVAEYFMTVPASITPESFYDMPKQQQADLIWQALFIDRSPLSEACRGVITTLKSLGLSEEISNRDLQAIRKYYSEYQSRGESGSAAFCENVFRVSGVRYAIMTNIPFSQVEAQYWRGPKQQSFSKRFRSALRVDPLLAGDVKTIEAALKASGYEYSLEGARQYLRDWVDTMKPEYMMASTPHDFVFEEGSLAGFANKTSVNTAAMYEPFAFATAGSAIKGTTCNGTEDDAPSVVNEHSDFLGEVLMKVCEELDLPVALKIGAHRGVNPRLKDAGDGVVAFADAGLLGRLCTKFPKVRFLATFLSRSNQHEAVVLASKFRNLHLYGCWWFCNNPSIIQEITSMRIEMLGTAFTAQHSDARVLDQLLYKWPHSRGVIAAVLAEQYEKLILSGWAPTRGEIRRDVQRLFGKSYEEFMGKSFVASS
ncbi:hypothetical protein IV203_037250 [Nitzschia inconspicua]|uniref:Mannitol dehydrogenase N-terminal domain-containing protein n=1 Tax=Nitzschia inconspicua TaxID=303405 RepID=A0A9K3PA75_9STRA|nr:hypothetical protein IV203_006572 [Nitzschia inconspicua]KAG7364048.1 hypothetical protein IV203_037250 [Nitzschia inconspicua]